MKWLKTVVEQARKEGKQPNEAVGLPEPAFQGLLKKPPNLVIGVDEVGWGAIAGPLAVGGVLATPDWTLPGIRDSKGFTSRSSRWAFCDKVFAEERAGNILTAIEDVSPKEIKRIGPAAALRMAMATIVERLCGRLSIFDGHRNGSLASYAFRNGILVVIDGQIDLSFLHVSFPNADQIVPQVGAASVIAKCMRDETMCGLAEICPGYGWETNSGYATEGHRKAIKKLGVTEFHRDTRGTVQGTLFGDDESEEV